MWRRMKKKRVREKEKEENQTERDKIRCEGFGSVEAFEIFSQGRDLESWDDFSGVDCELDACALVRVVLDVTDMPVSPSSVVTECCEICSGCSDWEDVLPQSFSFSKKRALCYTTTKEGMRHEDSPVKAPPPSRRRMTPPTPLQNSYPSFDGEQGRYEVEDQIWRAREKASWHPNLSSSSNERQWQVRREEQRVESSSSERKVMGAVENYLDNCADIKVDIEALARSIEPEDGGVCLMYILKYSTRRSSNILKLDGDGPDINCLDKFLIREPSDCVEKPRDAQSIYRET